MGVYLNLISDIILTRVDTKFNQPVKGSDLRPIRGEVELLNVRFRYADFEPYIVDGASLKIEPGESVAIVGGSGAGKSTLGKIILGLLEAESGQMMIDGIEVNSATASQLHRSTAAVMQDDQLLYGTILENITFFDIERDEDWVYECAAHAMLLADIEQMLMGFNTLIGEMGTSLSGGQRQRLLLARALCTGGQKSCWLMRAL